MRNIFVLLFLLLPRIVTAEQISPLWRSSPEAIEAMMKLGGVKKGDVFYDLGSGTGEVVAAAAERGATAIGIEIQPGVAAVSQRYLDKLGVKARIFNEDFFYSDISRADIVTLYLGEQANLKLRSKLFNQLKHGARIVSNEHDMGDLKPIKVFTLSTGKQVYLWVVK